MFEYSKKMRVCLIEYFIAMFVHVLYGFSAKGDEIGRQVILFAFLMMLINIICASIIKNDKTVIIILSVSVVFSFTVFGILLETLAYLVFALSIGIIFLTIFNEPIYILISSILSVFSLIIISFVFRDIILLNLPDIRIFYFFICLFVLAMITLHFSVRSSQKYFKVMQTKTIEAERAIDSKEFFLNNMSHEIRSPMNSICGLAELTLREELSPSVRENVENIQSSSKVLISIVNDILDYTKMENDSMEIIPISYSYSNLINDVISITKSRMNDKNIEIRSEIQNGLPDTLIGDEIRIRQILLNLLSNAVKYTDRGYIIIDTKGTVDGGFLDLTVSVTDTGIGIRKEELSKLFNIFQKVDTKKVNNEGTGLGLAICKRLLNMMGGDITVESTYGVGTKFVFNLSQKISSHNLVNTSYGSKKKEELINSTGKVLVVDDNAVNLKVAEGLLKTFGLQVETAKSGRQCLEILNLNKDYDIIFIDHMMPELDGIDTLRLIREKEDDYYKHVPIIALTANVVDGIRDMLISEGFDEYISKPIDMVWLNSILRKYLPKEKQQLK